MFKSFRSAVVVEEPTLAIQAVDAGLQVLQVSLLGIPTWAHAVIAAVIVTLAAFTNRQVVTPTAAVIPPSQATAS